MPKAAGWLRGAAEVRVTGAEPQKFLNRCVGLGIPLEDVSAADPFTLRLHLPARRLEEARRLAEKTGCTLEVLSTRGLPRAARSLRRRWILAVGMALLVLGLASSSLFVWEISVTENDSDIPDAEILRVLASQGVGVGSFWPAFRGERIRTEALRELPGLSFLAVNVRDSRGAVEVRAAVPRPEIWDPDLSADVVAARSGVVESVYPLSGEALISRGDAVTAGQTLIRGTTANPHALGEINAYTYYEASAAAPLTVMAKTYTGEEHRRFALILGTHRINFSWNSGILPADCDKMTKMTHWAVDNAFTLPVQWVTEIWRPYTAADKALDPETVRGQLEELLLSRLTEELPDGGEIVSTHFSAAADGDLLTVTLRAQCRERIDTEAPRAGE